MFGDIWSKTLWDQRRALLGWGIGFAAISFVYGGFFPLVDDPAYEDLLEAMPPALLEAFGWEDFVSPAGYLDSTVYGLVAGVLISVMAVTLGARAIAGSDEDGSLEILITQPVTRSRVVVHKSLALLGAMLLAGAVVFVAVLIINEPADLRLPVVNIAAASLDLALLGTLFGTVAVLAGSFRGRRGVVVGTTTAVVVIAFVMDALAPMVEALAWARNLSPFYWADAADVLENGINLGRTALLFGVAAVLVAAAVVAFNRRDVTV